MRRILKHRLPSRITSRHVLIVLHFFCFVIISSANSRKCYYDILSVNKTAPPKEIKKAYRKLALQHHPDKGGKEDDFKEISKAYEVLSDPEQRKMYDTYGDADVSFGGPNAYSYQQ